MRDGAERELVPGVGSGKVVPTQTEEHRGQRFTLGRPGHEARSVHVADWKDVWNLRHLRCDDMVFTK